MLTTWMLFLSSLFCCWRFSCFRRLCVILSFKMALSGLMYMFCFLFFVLRNTCSIVLAADYASTPYFSDDDSVDLEVEARSSRMDSPGSETCKPEIAATCQPGEWCTMHQGFANCFIPDLNCSGMCRNGATCSNFKCVCTRGFTGSWCEVELPCSVGQCLNGGFCGDVGCVCTSEYSGRWCQNKNPCNCLNEGVCRYTRCQCVRGFADDYCKVDNCTVTCMNGGSCRDNGCFCTSGFTGKFCQDESICTADQQCLNGGSCRYNRCVCTSGFMGRWCQDELPCSDNLECFNGGVCDNNRCICASGFTGRWCLDELPCNDRQCLNGGFCRLNRCHCPKGFAGKYCETQLDETCTVVCMNGGKCRNNACDCSDGFTGVRCEVKTRGISEPCNKDPCQGDCTCTPSCKHDNGYVCVSENGYIGKNCTIPIPTLTCREDAIVVACSQDFYREFDSGRRNSYIYMSSSFEDPEQHNQQCRATLTPSGDYVINIEQPFTQCGMTTELQSEGKLIFRNKLWINKRVGLGFDSPFGIISFECSYKTQLKIATSLRPTIEPPNPVVTETTRYKVSTTLCKVSTCPEPCSHTYRLVDSAIYTVGQIIHFGFDVAPTMAGLSGDSPFAVLDAAFLSCSSSQTSSPTTGFQIFQDGCPTNFGEDIQASYGRTSNRANHVCMSFRLPRSTRCGRLYIHLEFRVCHGETTIATCVNGMRVGRCSDEFTKRSVGSDSYSPLVFGPIYLLKEEAGKEHVTYLGADQALEIKQPVRTYPSKAKGFPIVGVLLVIGGISFIIAAAAGCLMYLRSRNVRERSTTCMS